MRDNLQAAGRMLNWTRLDQTRSRVRDIGTCVLRVASATSDRLVFTLEKLLQDQKDRDPGMIFREMVPQYSSWQGNMPEIFPLCCSDFAILSYRPPRPYPRLNDVHSFFLDSF